MKPQLANDANSRKYADQLDCGDGVPPLELLPRAPLPELDGPFDPPAKVSAKVFAMAATVLGQASIGLAVAAGGSAAIGLVAAVLVLLCGLAIVSTEVINAGE